ncbi:hypothetical protein LV779_04575 [Streptomyces thinghirensis]|nr:hypothetical protein [Streptomyces thinghirensis]
MPRGRRTVPQQRDGAAREPLRAAPAAKKPGRDRYLDLLRSIALVRVVVYHLFGWAWLSVVFRRWASCSRWRVR